MSLTKVSYSMLNGAPVNVLDFGAVGDGVTDNAASFQAAIDAVATTGQSIYLPAGTYVIGSALTSTGHLNMLGDGDKSILDFSGATIATSCITVEGEFTQIENISSASKYGLTVTFASAPSLTNSDVFCIFSTDLWFPIRANYFKGEWCEVRGVSGSNATISNPLYDSYTPATTSVYRLDSKAVSFKDMRIVGGDNTFGLIMIRFCDQPKVENVSCFNKVNNCVTFDRCYRPVATNCRMYNNGDGGDDYALVVANCQRARVIGGDYYARRHGITIGGTGEVGAVTNRDVRVLGVTLSNDITAGVYSADMHGNMEDCHYQDCTIYNGAGWAGANNGYDNCSISSQLNGSCIYSGEVKGDSLYLRNSRLITPADPSATGRGIVDVGGNSDSITSDTDRTLSLIVENCFVQGVNLSSNTDFMKVVNRGSSVNINIYIDGVDANVNATGSVLRTNLSSGTANSTAIVVDNISNFPSGAFLHIAQGDHYRDFPHRLMSQTDVLDMTATSGTKLTIAADQAFRYKYPRAPQAVVSIATTTAAGATNSAGENIGASIYHVTVDDIRPELVSTSNANWTATATKKVNWVVGISEV